MPYKTYKAPGETRFGGADTTRAGLRLIIALQDDLPDKWGGSTSGKYHRRREWLADHGMNVARLIELKGVERTADFLGMPEILVRHWYQRRDSC